MKPFLKKSGHFILFLLVLAAVWLPASGLSQGSHEETDRAGDYKDALNYVDASVTEKPRIAITFDDGPSKKWTPILLDGLAQRGIKATFFLIGSNAEKYPDIVKREFDEGHIVGNHTYHHVEITKLTDEEAANEIQMTDAVLENITGVKPVFLRPPFGAWQKSLEQKIDAFAVMWSLDPLDWATENTGEIVNKVVTQAKDGDIILLHDCYKSSVDAAFQIIDTLTQQGFEFVTVDEMIMD